MLNLIEAAGCALWGATMEARAEKLTLGEAGKDLIWFPTLFATIVSTPSWLSLLETVLENYRLSPGLQWIVDGYHRITHVLALAIEPFIAPIIAWINAHLGWQLMLYPHWQPLFLLTMILHMGTFRAILRRDLKWLTKFSSATFNVVMIIIAALIGSLLAGLMPIEGHWWEQGMLAMLPWLSMLVASALNGLPDRLAHLLGRHDPDYKIVSKISGRFEIVEPVLTVGALLFMVAASLSFIPGFERGAGIAALAAVLALNGVTTIVIGILHADRTEIRGGLYILSAFILAGMIVGANVLIETLG
jgi:hypothetical protein